MSADELISRIEDLGKQFADQIAPLSSEQEIRAFQAQFMGKKGEISQLMKQMGKVPAADRRHVGEVFNRVKGEISDAVTTKLAALEEAAEAADLERVVDVSLPGRSPALGHKHLLTSVSEEVVAIFSELGFEVATGPQIETDFHCFEALAIPKDHPARDMQDTFYVSDEVVLRTHTSSVQIRTMLSQKPPVKIVSPGVVYRRDDDPTHSPMFTQLEGLLVDEGVRFSDLKGVLLYYVRRFFGKALEIRLRPSYFPFVEPGAEVDMQCSFCMGAGCRLCKGTGWIEIAGCGMVDPEVFGHVGYDAERYTGFAFGMGMERMAMLRHGVNDIKYYYEGDLRFSRQF
ncbi:phenylalanine--tRNA ligase subunit alpha [Haliangium ochraceum]|uniref:Phenylalanine--tRNA ligase alpha subunit n=1 Tax=Haliangium ochraceum (strain DSM 14365 / JCM 11303 / SMP-2) TaxID=502025 RepID=D0LY94_HALO1|nr:phenylalanine--tRNA ligase subunit alpha [Haliangium ochraceum]ACY16244.1 phenylalanyl-tRNA synthetase, alpha subunit [Haliangium ochraceum DSM 14365]